MENGQERRTWTMDNGHYWIDGWSIKNFFFLSAEIVVFTIYKSSHYTARSSGFFCFLALWSMWSSLFCRPFKWSLFEVRFHRR